MGGPPGVRGPMMGGPQGGMGMPQMVPAPGTQQMINPAMSQAPPGIGRIFKSIVAMDIISPDPLPLLRFYMLS